VKEVEIHIDIEDERVILGFNKSVDWIGLTPVVAIRVAETLKSKAIEVLRSEVT
jgi:hypothetical protein